MTYEIEEFIGYLHNTKGTSKNTEVSYERDLRKLEQFLRKEGITEVEAITSTNLNSYILYMEREKFAASGALPPYGRFSSISVRKVCLKKIRRID